MITSLIELRIKNEFVVLITYYDVRTVLNFHYKGTVMNGTVFFLFTFKPL